MASATVKGRRRRRTTRATASSSPLIEVPEGPIFLEQWNRLPKTDRVYVRRMVRTGQRFKAGEKELARMGVAYSRYQMSKPWQRLFWIWLPPALVLAFSAGMRIHELIAGAVLGAALLAWSARRNLKRAKAINGTLLTLS